MDERPSFAEIVAFAASGAALGGMFVPGAMIVLAALSGGVSLLLGMFLAMTLGGIIGMFTAFPLGVVIAWPVFRFLGRSAYHAASVGLACAGVLWWLAIGYGGIGVFAAFGTWWWLVHLAGICAGWAAHRFSFPFMAWPER